MNRAYFQYPVNLKQQLKLRNFKSINKLIRRFPFITLLLIQFLFPQHISYRFERLGIADGLSQSTVYTVLQDSRGFMWFGTDDGLNRYDGYDFKVYRHDPEKEESVGSNSIYCLLEDSEGFIWVGTSGGGLSRFNRKTDTFKTYQHDPDNPYSLNDNSIWDLLEDKTGRIWIATESGGLNYYNPAEDRFFSFENHPGNPDSISDNNVYSLYEDMAGYIWVGTSSGLNKLDPEMGIFTSIGKDKDDNSPNLWTATITDIYQENSGLLWVGTATWGLCALDIETGSQVFYQHEIQNPASISDNTINNIFEDETGVLWIATSKGLNQFDREKGSFQHFFHDTRNPASICSSHILDVYEDRSGILWFGSESDGLSKMIRNYKRFIHFANDPVNPNLLTNNHVFAIAEDHLQNLWVGTWNGLNKSHPDYVGFKHFYADLHDSTSLTSNSIWSILEDSKGYLWIGTEFGLNRGTPEQPGLQHFYSDPTTPNVISGDIVYTLMEDKNGLIWIGTDNGMDVYDYAVGYPRPFQSDPNIPGSGLSERISFLLEGSDGTVWVGTDNGLVNISPDLQSMVRYRHDIQTAGSLANNNISFIHEDYKGGIWVGTLGGGICRFNQEAKIFKQYSVKDGLPNNTVYAILEDDDHKLWISSNAGLTRFDPVSKRVRNYDILDGLQSNEFNSGSAFKNAGGQLFFGGINGFNAFTPSKIQDNAYLPTVVLTDFRVAHESVAIHSERTDRHCSENPITECTRIILSPTEDVISFQFAALNFINTGRNQYAYKLEGYEDNWNYSGSRRFVTYTNLPYGEFTFRVKASNNDGVWNEADTAIQIIHETPFWAKPLFRIGAVFILLGLFWSLGQLRSMKTKATNIQLKGMNEDLLEQIAERKKAEEELNKYKDHLEDLVALRTEEVRESREELKQERDMFIGGQVVVFKWLNQPGLPVDYVSPNVENVYGYSSQEFLEKKLKYYDIIHPNDLIFVKKNLNDAVEGQTPSFTHQPYRVTKKDGSIAWLQDFTTLSRKEDGTVSYFLGYVVDITDRVKAEKEVAEKQTQLVHAGRLASLGEMATGIAHELNQPLSIIRAQCELIDIVSKKNDGDITGCTEDLKLIIDEVDRAAQIINHMRGFARKSTDNYRTTDLRDPLSKSLVFFRQQFKVHEIHLDIIISDDLPSIYLDPQHFEQIVVNFMSNARYAVDKYAETAGPDLRKQVVLSLMQNDTKDHIILEVRDNGMGMESGDVERCVDPFFTKKDVGEGTGLGLSIVHGLLKDLGGYIEIKSQPGKGSSFRAYIPVHQNAEQLHFQSINSELA